MIVTSYRPVVPLHASGLLFPCVRGDRVHNQRLTNSDIRRTHYLLHPLIALRQDEDVATMKRESRKTVVAMRKATSRGTGLASKYCPRGLEHLTSPEELAHRCRLREDLTRAVLEEQSHQRREGISRPHALASVSSIRSKWTRDDSYQAAMNDAAVAARIYSGVVDNDHRPTAAPAALLPCVNDVAIDVAPSSNSTFQRCPQNDVAARSRSSSLSSSRSNSTTTKKTTNGAPTSTKGGDANASLHAKEDCSIVGIGSDAFSMSKLQRSLDITCASRTSSPEPH